MADESIREVLSLSLAKSLLNIDLPEENDEFPCPCEGSRMNDGTHDRKLRSEPLKADSYRDWLLQFLTTVHRCVNLDNADDRVL